MTTALDDLIAAVEANDWQDMVLAYNLKGLNPTHVRHAYRGSLDAALALHNAVLPGWTWRRLDDGEFALHDENSNDWATAYSENPARAWLLAILRAMREGKQ